MRSGRTIAGVVLGPQMLLDAADDASQFNRQFGFLAHALKPRDPRRGRHACSVQFRRKLGKLGRKQCLPERRIVPGTGDIDFIRDGVAWHGRLSGVWTQG